MRPPLLTAVLLLTVLIGSSAAATLTGRVVDSDGYGLAGANVIIDGTKLGAATNLDGDFELTIRKSLPDEITLSVSLVGYKSVQRTLATTAATATPLSFTLEVDHLALEEVNYETERIQSGPVAEGSDRVEVVTAEELAEASSDGGLLSALSGGTGLDTKPCALCGSAGVGMQGLDPSYTEINVDGLPVLSGLGALYGLDGISVSDLQQVEIAKGGQGLAGANAMAGSVNLITSIPDGPISQLPRGQVTVMGGETGRHRVGAEVSVPLADQPVTVSASYAGEPRKLDRNGDGLTDTPAYERLSLNLRGQRAVTGGDLTLRLRGYQEERFAGETHWTEADRGSADVYGRDIQTQRIDTGLRFMSQGYEWGSFSGDAAFVHHEQDSYYGTTRYDARQTIGIARMALSRFWNEYNNTLFRAQYRDENYRDNLALPSATDRHDRVPGLLVQHDWKAQHSWQARASVLSEVYDADGFVATPRLSLSYSPNPEWLFLAAGGTGYRTVSLFSLDKAAHAGFDNVLVPANLDAERSLGGTLTTQYRAGNEFVAFNADLTGFYTRFENKVIVAYGDAHHGEVLYANANDAYSRGVEAQLGFAFQHDWSLRVQGTFNDIQYHDGIEWRREEMRSAFTGGAKLEKAWPSLELSAFSELSLFGPQQLPEGRARSESPTYGVVNAGVRKSWGRYSLSLRGENLTDYVQPDEVFVTDPSTGQRRLDAAMIYGPQLGRTVSLTFTAAFGGDQ